jgi:hypothetical protein
MVVTGASSNDERLVAVEAAIGVLNRDVAAIKVEINTDFAEIKQDIRELRDTYSRRPSWSVLSVISFLGALSSALGATLLTMLVQAGG